MAKTCGGNVNELIFEPEFTSVLDDDFAAYLMECDTHGEDEFNALIEQLIDDANELETLIFEQRADDRRRKISNAGFIQFSQLG